MQDSLLAAWLMSGTTITAVLAPACAYLAGFLLVPAWRAGAAPLVAIAVACSPAVYATAFWDERGLHLVPLCLLPFAFLLLVRRLNMRRHWFGVSMASWVGIALPAAAEAWSAWGGAQPGPDTVLGTDAPYSSMPAWYWGIGGDGAADVLVMAPAVTVAALWIAQLAAGLGKSIGPGQSSSSGTR